MLNRISCICDDCLRDYVILSYRLQFHNAPFYVGSVSIVYLQYSIHISKLKTNLKKRYLPERWVESWKRVLFMVYEYTSVTFLFCYVALCVSDLIVEKLNKQYGIEKTNLRKFCSYIIYVTDIMVADGTAHKGLDFNLPTAKAIFPAVTSTATATLSIIPDTETEDEEEFYIYITPSRAFMTSGIATATICIIDDDETGKQWINSHLFHRHRHRRKVIIIMKSSSSSWSHLHRHEVIIIKSSSSSALSVASLSSSSHHHHHQVIIIFFIIIIDSLSSSSSSSSTSLSSSSYHWKLLHITVLVTFSEVLTTSVTYYGEYTTSVDSLSIYIISQYNI